MADGLMATLTSKILVAHGKVYAATDGRVGHHLLGVPCLLLHTVGARTAEPRVNSLTYAKDGASYVVVASAGGGPRHPGWYHNLRKQPAVEIHVGPHRMAATARTVLPGDADHARLWALVNDNNKQRYAGYQRRTSRPIPVVVLTPLSPTG